MALSCYVDAILQFISSTFKAKPNCIPTVGRNVMIKLWLPRIQETRFSCFHFSNKLTSISFKKTCFNCFHVSKKLALIACMYPRNYLKLFPYNQESSLNCLYLSKSLICFQESGLSCFHISKKLAEIASRYP